MNVNNQDSIKSPSVSMILESTFQNIDKFSENSAKSLSEYYSHFLQEGKGWLDQNEEVYKEIYTFLSGSHERPPILLDVGCGVGTESICFSLMGAKTIGVEPSISRLNTCIERMKLAQEETNLDLKFTSEEFFTLKGMYNIIWLNNTFHHIEPREKFSEKINSILKPGGIIIFAETNSLNPLLQLQFLKWRGFKTIIEMELECGKVIPFGNERITRGGKICKLFEKFSYTKESLHYFQYLPNKRVFHSANSSLRKKKFPRFLCCRYVLILKKPRC